MALLAALLGAAVLLSACGHQSASDHMAKATKYFDNGKYRSATIELKNVLQSQPKNAQAWFELGKISFANGDFDDAAHQFGKARKHGLDNPQLDRLLAQSFIGGRKFKKALALLDPEKADSANSRAETYALQGRAYLGLKKKKQAKQALASSLDAKPDNPAALVEQARLAWQMGNRARAQKMLDKVTKANPAYGRGWVVAGNLAYAQQRCDDVAAAFKQIQDLKAHTLPRVEIFNARAHTAFCQLRRGELDGAASNIKVLMQHGPKNPYANYLKGLLAYLNKNYDEATTHVQEALSRSPNNLSALMLSGKIKSKQGDLKGAQQQFTQAVQQAPNSLRARQLLASVYMHRGMAGQAAKVLQEALQKHGENPQVLAQLGEASVRAGQRAQGLRYLQHSAQYAAGNPGMQMALAREMAKAGGVDSALALLQQVQSGGHSKSLKFELLRIALYLRNKQPDKAIAEARQLVQKHPKKTRFVRLLARVYAAAGQRDKARATLQDALQSAPHDADIHLDLGRLAAREGDHQSANKIFHGVHDAHPDNVQAVLALGRGAARQGDKAQAVSWFKKAAKLKPDSIGIRVDLTRAYLAQGQSDKALEVAESLVADNPDNARLHWLKASVLVAADQHEAALASMKKAVDLAPDVLKLRLDLARMEISQKHLVSAVSELQDIRKQYPDSVSAAALLAEAQVRQGELKSALATADSLREDGKHDAASYALRGQLLQGQKQYDKAAAAYAKAYDEHPARRLALRQFAVRKQGDLAHPEKPLLAWLKQHPHDARVMATLAQWYQATDKHEEAKKQYRALLARYPDNALALNNLAWIYYAEGDGRALKLAEQAHSAAPHSAPIMDTLGWILVNKGDNDKGLPLLRQAAKAASAPEIQYHLAVALTHSGDHDQRKKAKKILTRLLASDQSFESRRKANQLLKELDK
jgi:putative PEP-CTERM system TPR-repeat lipoprotein